MGCGYKLQTLTETHGAYEFFAPDTRFTPPQLQSSPLPDVERTHAALGR